VRVLVQQEDETATLDEVVRSGLPPGGGTDRLQEVFRELRTKDRQRAGHGDILPIEEKQEPSICCLL
jgi:hypothetical protein